MGGGRLGGDQCWEPTVAVEYDLAQVFLPALVDAHGHKIVDDKDIDIDQFPHLIEVVLVSR